MPRQLPRRDVPWPFDPREPVTQRFPWTLREILTVFAYGTLYTAALWGICVGVAELVEAWP